MKKTVSVCLATIILLLTVQINVSAVAPPRYPAPIFYCKTELTEWLKTADAENFHEGNFSNSLPQVRERGEILLPAIVDDRITFQGVEVLRFAQRGVTLFMRFMTPEGQLVVSIEEIDPRFASEYESGGIEAYFTALDNDRYERALSQYLHGVPMPSSRELPQRPLRNDNYQLRQRRISMRDFATGEHTERILSYVHVDNPRTGHVNFSYFIINGFVVRSHHTHQRPEIWAFLDGLIWEITPIILDDSCGEIRIFLDGERLAFDVPPQIIDGRTMVPMRGIFEALGAKVEWDGETQTIIAEVTYVHQTIVTLQIDNDEMRVTTYYLWIGVPLDSPRYDVFSSRDVISLDIPPQIVDGRTFVPLRAVWEIFLAVVEWDADTRTITIER